MANKVRNEVAVGVTVLVVLILTIYIILALGDPSGARSEQKEITVRLPYKTGLKGLVHGSPIFLGGVRIGQVTQTDIIASQGQNASVDVSFTMQIPESYPIREDGVLEVHSNLLGGQMALVIQDLGKDKPVLNDGDVVTMRFGGGLSEVMASIQREMDVENPDGLMFRVKNEFDRDYEGSFVNMLLKTVANLDEVSEQIKYQLSATTDEKSLVARLNQAMEKVNLSLDQIEVMIRENKGKVDSALTALDKTAKALESEVPELMAKLHPALDNANRLIEDANEALVYLTDASKSTRDLVQVNRDSVNTMVDNFQKISSNLKLASQEIRRSPWKLMAPPSEKQEEQARVVHAADSFALAAERLDGVSLRLQRVVDQSQGAGQIEIHKEQVDEVMAQLQESFQQFREAEKVFWQQIR